VKSVVVAAKAGPEMLMSKQKMVVSSVRERQQRTKHAMPRLVRQQRKI